MGSMAHPWLAVNRPRHWRMAHGSIKGEWPLVRALRLEGTLPPLEYPDGRWVSISPESGSRTGGRRADDLDDLRDSPVRRLEELLCLGPLPPDKLKVLAESKFVVAAIVVGGCHEPQTLRRRLGRKGPGIVRTGEPGVAQHPLRVAQDLIATGDLARRGHAVNLRVQQVDCSPWLPRLEPVASCSQQLQIWVLAEGLRVVGEPTLKWSDFRRGTFCLDRFTETRIGAACAYQEQAHPGQSQLSCRRLAHATWRFAPRAVGSKCGF